MSTFQLGRRSRLRMNLSAAEPDFLARAKTDIVLFTIVIIQVSLYQVQDSIFPDERTVGVS